MTKRTPQKNQKWFTMGKFQFVHSKTHQISLMPYGTTSLITTDDFSEGPNLLPCPSVYHDEHPGPSNPFVRCSNFKPQWTQWTRNPNENVWPIYQKKIGKQSTTNCFKKWVVLFQVLHFQGESCERWNGMGLQSTWQPFFANDPSLKLCQPATCKCTWWFIETA